MKVVFFVRDAMPEGGITLATFRLAAALLEQGHEARVLYRGGRPPENTRHLAERLEASLVGEAQRSPLRRSLERASPDLIVVGSRNPDDITEALEVAPTLLHAHLHAGTCPDLARYWMRLRKPCSVRASWGCAALRPLVGCSELSRSLQPSPIREQRRLLSVLATSGAGVLAVSSSQAESYVSHGVPRERVGVLPNLGIRATAAQLAGASAAVAEDLRSATVFVGRLSKPKGAELLPELARLLPADARLRVFGDGYLAPRLTPLLRGALRGHIEQDQVAGVLMWARALAFPSLWPEPGGIVGIDAQLMGVPVAAFATGAPRDWPAAERFGVGDVADMAAWLGAQPPRSFPRDPAAVEAAQRSYWERIGARGAELFSEFRRRNHFQPRAQLAESLLPRSNPQEVVAR